MLRWSRVAPLLLLAVLAAPATAQVNLGWNDTGPQMLPTLWFNCDSEDGADTLVASFIAPVGVTKLVRLEAVIDFCSGLEDLPDWWQFNGCRSGAVTVSSAMGPVQNWWNDYWQGRGDAGVVFEQRGPNLGRLVVDIQLDASEAGPLVPGGHYYAFRLFLDHTRSTGLDVCRGCEIPVCLVLNDVRLIWPEGEVRLNGPDINYGSGWQGFLVGCPFIVPIVPTTWSGIKTLLD